MLDTLVTFVTALVVTTNPLTYPVSIPVQSANAEQDAEIVVEKNTVDPQITGSQVNTPDTAENPVEINYSGEGHDVSWPNCDVSLPQKDFGIVGVNYGSPFTVNPCFSQQYDWAKNSTSSASIYMNLDLNPAKLPEKGMSGGFGNCSSTDYDCQAKNYGYNAAKEAHEYALSKGANDAKMWWLDVEPLNIWTGDVIYNRLSIDGAVAYFNEKNVEVGAYSTPMLWKDITGDYKNGLPVWPALIDSTPQTACGTGFTGGKTLVVQYNQEYLDKNFAC